MGNSAVEKVTALLNVVEERRQQAEEAHNRVTQEVNRLTENEINILGTDALSRLNEIAVKVRESNDTKYAELQALVLMIDQECRPLLKENLPYSVVSSIVFMINRLNEESKISTTFNATLQGYDMGNVATSNYLPSIECKMIQSFWQTTCDAMPEAVAEKKEASEEAKKFTQMIAERMERENATKKAFEEAKAAYKKAHEEWEKEYKRAKLQNSTELGKRLPEEKRKREEELKKKRDDEIAKREKALGKEKARKERAETDLLNAGLFEFSKKKELKAVIASATESIDNIVKKQQKIEKEFEAEMHIIRGNEFKKQLEAQIEKENPYPMKPVTPKMPYDTTVSGTSVSNMTEDEKKRRAIYAFMQVGELYTLDEIAKCVRECKGMDNKSVYLLLERLRYDQKVEKIEDKRRPYFRISKSCS